MIHKNITVILCILLLAAPAYVSAQLGIGPMAGYQKAADAEEGNIMGGAVLRLKLPGALGAEASINYRQEKYADGALTVRSWPVMVSGLIYPLPIVYGVVGVGWYNTTFDYDSELVDNETEQEFGWHFGAGVEFPLKNVTLTGDIRYVFLDYDFEDSPRGGDVDADFFMISAGLIFGL